MTNTEQNEDNSGEKRCMHCGTPGAYPFCIGGGKLPMGGKSKSYCFQSFRVMANQQKRMEMDLTKDQEYVLNNMELFIDWAKGLPGEDY